MIVVHHSFPNVHPVCHSFCDVFATMGVLTVAQVHSLEGCKLRHGRIAAILPGAGVDSGPPSSHVAAPLSAFGKASIQAGRYDKWQIRKQIEEEIKSVLPASFLSPTLFVNKLPINH